MKLKKYVGILVFVLAMLFGINLSVLPQKVLAVEPGCYEDTASNEPGDKVSCPSGQDLDPTKCYRIVNGVRGNPDYYEVFDCGNGDPNYDEGGYEQINQNQRSCETGGEGTWVPDASNPNGGSCRCSDGFNVTPIRGDDGVTRDVCVISQEEITRREGGLDESNPIITKVLKPVIRTLSAAVGLVIIISLIIAGIQYSAARDNAQMVAAAKMRILMAIVSLLIFIFGFAVLQWLVPNGIL